MADSKVTEFSSAVTFNVSDILYIIQSTTDKKTTLATLLGNLPNTPTKMKGQLALSGTAQALSGEGIITATETVTTVENAGGVNEITIDDGLHDGQIKILLFESGAGTSVISANVSVGSITFSQSGQTCLLFWFNNSWWPIGGTATITP